MENSKILIEYMENPVGIERGNPFISWYIDTDHPESIDCWKLTVTAPKRGLETEKILWKIEGKNDCTGLLYKGEPLESGEKYNIRLRMFKSSTKVLEITSWFITGFIKNEKWDADWIVGPSPEKTAFWYRSEFELQEKCGLVLAFVMSPCYSVFSVNGERADDSVLNNAWTDPQQTIPYRIYNVTGLVHTGKNGMGVILGNGWHNDRKSEYGIGWGDYPFSLKLMLYAESGKKQWINSKPEHWMYAVDGPIVSNSIYHGETYDARREIKGWDKAGFTMGDDWKKTIEHEPMHGIVRAQMPEPIRPVRKLYAERILENSDGTYTFDFGQNFAGWASLDTAGNVGDEITLMYAELIHSDGSINPISLRRARATDVFILSGRGEEHFEPHFTYHGFRYVQVKGLKKRPDRKTVTGIQIRSDCGRVGDFKCSDQLINRLYKNILWTEESNLYGIPTDCPQRDERLGWLNDMTVRNECALYNYRLVQLYGKWMQDICDAQGKISGAITDTVPYMRYGLRNADPVATSFLLIPWNLYRFYGDDSFMKRYYGNMKMWVDYLLRNMDNDIVKYSQMGDWASPVENTGMNSLGSGSVSLVTPSIQIGTGFVYYDCVLLSCMADVMGRLEEKDYYRANAERIATAFNRNFFSEENGYYCNNSQASNAFAIYVGLVKPEHKNRVLLNLVKDIEQKNIHLSTGNICTRYTMEVLFQNGYEDLAYSLLTQTTYPSWGYMVEKGATTMWERWELVEEEGPYSRMASHNHPMSGAFGVCFHKYILGINPDEESPGFNHVIIHPIIPGQLNEASGYLEIKGGRIKSAWKKQNGCLNLEAYIPFGCTARIEVPGGAGYQAFPVKAGWHTFHVEKEGNIHYEQNH
ncbi:MULTISPECIES: alpha-L-rhamnosidase [Clostridia]|uniref:alpha-L-rhamnosidase n=1 Tax=Clostridia TaxID=186801 RepID=UPI0005D305BC|nr:alpha-L-rhamnosidase [Clostridium sp. FS41]KJJ71425.1 bacterial alpha-L-rhamnosidase [Clostridium sp. FS41]